MYLRNGVIALAENQVSLTSCTKWLPSTSSRENVPFAEHKYNYTCTCTCTCIIVYVHVCVNCAKVYVQLYMYIHVVQQKCIGVLIRTCTSYHVHCTMIT